MKPNPDVKKMTIAERIEELQQWHGVTLRGLSRLLKIDVGFLSRLKAGKKQPSATTIKKLGLRRIVTYELRK